MRNCYRSRLQGGLLDLVEDINEICVAHLSTVGDNAIVLVLGDLAVREYFLGRFKAVQKRGFARVVREASNEE